MQESGSNISMGRCRFTGPQGEVDIIDGDFGSKDRRLAFMSCSRIALESVDAWNEWYGVASFGLLST